MNDALLKNAKLSKEQKKLVKAILNGNFDEEFCIDLFGKAIAKDILTQSKSLVRDFRKYVSRFGFVGVDFEEVKQGLLDKHPVSQFKECLCNSLHHRLNIGEKWSLATHGSLSDAVSKFEAMTKDNILIECRNELRDKHQKDLKLLTKTINELKTDSNRIIESANQMNLNMFKKETALVTDIDAGPKSNIIKGGSDE